MVKAVESPTYTTSEKLANFVTQVSAIRVTYIALCAKKTQKNKAADMALQVTASVTLSVVQTLLPLICLKMQKIKVKCDGHADRPIDTVTYRVKCM